jgi:hypothetical protein
MRSSPSTAQTAGAAVLEPRPDTPLAPPPLRAADPPAPVPAASPLARPHVGRPHWTARFAWLNRPRRVLLTLAAVWIVAVFDLGYTLAERGSQDFRELNPIAAHILAGPSVAVMAYKFGLLSAGTIILLALRRHFVAELACWLLFAAMIYLAQRWCWYFGVLLQNYADPVETSVDQLTDTVRAITP